MRGEFPQLFNKPRFINLTPMVRGPGTKKGALGPEPRTREAPSDPRPKHTSHERKGYPRWCWIPQQKPPRRDSSRNLPRKLLCPRRHSPSHRALPIPLTGALRPARRSQSNLAGHRAAGDPGGPEKRPRPYQRARTSSWGPFISHPAWQPATPTPTRCLQRVYGLR